MYTRRGINHVIGLRKFIQSSTVDLCGHLGAKMFYFFYFYSYKRKLYFVTNDERNKVVSGAIMRCCRRLSRRHCRRFVGVKVGIINFGIDLVCLHTTQYILHIYTSHSRGLIRKQICRSLSLACLYISFFSSPRCCSLPPPLNNMYICIIHSLSEPTVQYIFFSCGLSIFLEYKNHKHNIRNRMSVCVRDRK